MMPVARVELCQPAQLTIPGRWAINDTSADRESVLRQLDEMAGTLASGAEALCGLYMRMSDTVRDYGVPNDEARKILSRHFPPARVSEFLRVANAPPEIYRRYRAGFFGFKAALAECRGYRLTDDAHQKKKKMRYSATRLLKLAGYAPAEILVLGFKVTIERQVLAA